MPGRREARQRSKVLLMIDDASFGAALEKGLGAAYHTVFVPAGSAIQKVFDEVPHLIVLDEDWSGGEGRNLALGIKEDVVLKSIPVILLVRHADVRYAGFEEPIDLYFEKGRDIRHLLLSIEEMIGKNSNELDLNPLTHLPGTHSTVLEIEKTVQQRRAFSFCCLDLSDLGAFNAAYGDARGDDVIVMMANILREVLKASRRDDFVGHLGGDKFIVLTDPEHATAFTQELIRRFDERITDFYDSVDRSRGYFLLPGADGVLTRIPIMTIMVAIVEAERGVRLEITRIGRIAAELRKSMKPLRASCYLSYGEVRDAQRHQLEVHFPTRGDSVWVPGLLATTDRDAALLEDILKGRKIQTVFQPIIELKTRRITGYEALTRCAVFGEHPERLFARARDLGLVEELDRLCVDSALESAQALPAGQKLFLNINLETLIDSRRMDEIFRHKGAIGFKSIVIEVTEQSILRSFEKLKDALLDLKEQGVGVAIDDVGGGAVSLRDVAVLRPDYIKFDRSLIRQIDANITKQQIILSMLLFANGIQAMTTAEGIETNAEFRTVQACGIHLGQGFYFAKAGKAFPKVEGNL
ncbi:MAG TPA: EAL domain-containing protein [Candidatus Eisenbacteria bacterium]|nr:EAL domain-containing protein [Candidatus Eisenbacteria bacterium]